MKWRTILLIGFIVFIVFIVFNFALFIKATTTVPKAEQRERREGHVPKAAQRKRREGHENVQLSCPKSLDAAIGDNVTLDFHLKPQWNATKWKAFVFECKQSSDIALVYKSGDFSDVDQAKRFRGRVSPDSSWELREGKLAWKISKFGQSDVGTYKCIVRRRKLNCSTELKIKQDHPHELNPSDGYQRHNTGSSIPEKPTDNNSTDPTNTLPDWAIAVIVIAVIAVIAFIVFIAGVICLRCRKRFEGVRQNDPDAQGEEGRPRVQEEPNDQNEGEEGIQLEVIRDANPLEQEHL